MPRVLCPTNRYIVLRQGEPVLTSDDCDALVAYLWGRHIRDGYVVLDYEIPYPVDTPDLTAFIARLRTPETSR